MRTQLIRMHMPRCPLTGAGDVPQVIAICLVMCGLIHAIATFVNGGATHGGAMRVSYDPAIAWFEMKIKHSLEPCA
jgi:hypothetical protein